MILGPENARTHHLTSTFKGLKLTSDRSLVIQFLKKVVAIIKEATYESKW